MPTNRNPFVDHPEWVNLTFAPPHTHKPVLTISLLGEGFAIHPHHPAQLPMPMRQKPRAHRQAHAG